MANRGIAFASVAVGAVFLYAGIKGKSVPQAFQYVLTGKNPESLPNSNPINGTSGGSGAVLATNSAVANDALSYVGSKYVWGGVPGTVPGHDNGTDCSGFVNMVLGRDLGMAIPGYGAGQYTGSAHGPVAAAYLLWGGVKGITESQVQAGDLLVWQTHIGIATGNGQMVSALDTQSGVIVTSINGGSPTGEVLFPKRLTGLSGVYPTPSGQPDTGLGAYLG